MSDNPLKKPRWSCCIRDRESKAIITLDYANLASLAKDFGRILDVLASTIERNDLHQGPTTNA